MINAGESVQVFSTIIIGSESKEWHNGYVFHSYEENGTVVVERTKGIFKGIKLRYMADDVRKVPA